MPIQNPVSNERSFPEISTNAAQGRNQVQPAQVAVYTYDFTKQGGAISTIPLIGDVLPPNTVVIGGFMRVITVPTGGGASIALQLEAANDIINAAAISGVPWSTPGTKAIIPVFTAGSSVVTTVARSLKAVITSTALTAGKIQVVLFLANMDG